MATTGKLETHFCPPHGGMVAWGAFGAWPPKHLIFPKKKNLKYYYEFLKIKILPL